MKRKIKTLEITLLAVLVFAAALIVQLDIEQARLADKLIRLHVIANSDSEYDQGMKLRVRDRVLESLSGAIKPGMSRDEAARAVSEKFDDIIAAAKLETGDIPVNVTLDNEYYPTRKYDTFSLPAGEYLSLRVMIGKAEGHNWWCVVFPPLCTGICTDEAAAAWGLSEDEAALIQSEDGYIIRFRLIEWWEQLKNKLG